MSHSDLKKVPGTNGVHDPLAPAGPTTMNGSTVKGTSTSSLPIWIRKSTIISFMFLFIGCACSLIALDHNIATQGGLPLTLTENHYSWTYGPTAILVVILSLWRQVDYHLKIMQPWWELVKGPTPGSKSVLLDYISPFQAFSCYRAIHQGHYAIVASIIGFVLVKLIILVSTTLFIVTPSLVSTGSVDTTYQSSFRSPDPSKFLLRQEYPGTDRSIFTEGPDTATWSYLTTVNNATGRDPLVYQGINLPASIPPNLKSLSATVDLFDPEMNCDRANLTVRNQDDSGVLIYRVESPECTTQFEVAMRYGYQVHHLDRVNCLLDHNPGYVPDNPPKGTWDSTNITDDIPQDFRYILTSSQFTFEWNQHYDYDESFHLKRYSAFVCKFAYGILPVNATRQVSNARVLIERGNPNHGPTHLDNLTDFEMMELVFASLLSQERIGSLVTDKNLFNPNQSYAPGPLFQLMAAYLGNPGDSDIFFDHSASVSSFKAVVEGVAREIARDELLFPDNSTAVRANGQGMEQRLFIRHSILWTMVAGFIILAALCILILVITSKASQTPSLSATGSIAAHAVILSQSPTMVEILKDTGACNSKQLQQILGSSRFSMHSSTVEVMDSLNGQGIAHDSTIDSTTQWIPLSAKTPMIIVTLTAPLVGVAILEYLQRLSDSRHGLFEINAGASLHTTVVRLVFALGVFGIATLYNNLDFTITTFAPYSRLKKGKAKASESLAFHLQGMSPPHALFMSLRCHHFGVIASSVAVFAASFLTIAVSGLWVTTSPLQSQSVAVAAMDVWNSTSQWLPSDTMGDRGATLELNAIRHGGQNAPLGLWGDVVLPKVSLPQSAITANTTHVFPVQALRPTLNCNILPSDAIKITKGNRTLEVPEDRFQYTNVSISVPDCGAESQLGGGNNTFGMTYIYDPEETFVVAAYFELDPTIVAKADEDCPSIGILFGGITSDTVEDTERLTALACQQKIQELTTNLTYIGDSLVRQPDSGPPSNFTYNSRTWAGEVPPDSRKQDYRLHWLQRAYLVLFRNNFFITNAEGDDLIFNTRDPPPGRYFDRFFDNIMYGPMDFPVETLIQANRSDERAKRLIEAVTKNYVEYMALVIDKNFRPTPPNTTPVHGTRTSAYVRMAMHRPSKIALQALLGVMTLLGAASFRLTSIPGTLPRDPCSIASTMGFLAGSPKLLEVDAAAADVQTSAEGKEGAPTARTTIATDKQLRMLFDGYVYSLGWRWQELDLGREEEGEEEEGEEQSESMAMMRSEGEEEESNFSSSSTIGYTSNQVVGPATGLDVPPTGESSGVVARRFGIDVAGGGDSCLTA